MFKLKLIVILMLVALATSACSLTLNFGDRDSLTDGGVFKSENNGNNWKQKALVANVSGQPQSFNFTNILAIAIDPQDNQAIYAGTEENGLFYSYDGGSSWNLARNLGKRTIQGIAIDPQNKCIIYVASDNRILKSIDCSRNWEEIYYDNSPGVLLSNLVIDPTDSRYVYSGTSRGEVIRSSDYGESWTTIGRFDKDPLKPTREANISIIKVILNPNNPRMLFAATAEYGIYKTTSRGGEWVDFAEEFMEIDTKNSLKVSDITISPNGKTVLTATKAGIIRSDDSGQSWSLAELIPPGDRTFVNVIVLDPTNDAGIYYATPTTFGWSDDQGVSWTSKKLPSNRSGSVVVADYTDSGTVYLGVKKIEK